MVPPGFNRHFLVQWTALWVIRIPPRPAVASPYNTITEGRREVMAAVSERGQPFTRTDTQTHTRAHSHSYGPHRATDWRPLTSVHPCASNWNTAAFPPGLNGIGLPFPGTSFLTGLALLPTDCPHGFSRCHETPATSAKSTVLRHCQVPDSEFICMKWMLWLFRRNKKSKVYSVWIQISNFTAKSGTTVCLCFVLFWFFWEASILCALAIVFDNAVNKMAADSEVAAS